MQQALSRVILFFPFHNIENEANFFMKMFLRKTSLLLLFVGCFLVYLPHTASAQGIVTGTITGTITDASGAVVPGAPVVATNTATGVKITGVTDTSTPWRL